MTALPGGAAEKFGGDFEDLWTVLRIVDLLQGRVSRILLEPVGAPGTGVEFTVDVDGVTWGEQAKSTSKHWTIAQLTKEGVLAGMKVQLDIGHRYRLVAASGSQPLDWLTYRARKTGTYEEFAELALTSGDRREDFERIASEWDTTDHKTWELLCDVQVSQRPYDSLEREAAAAMRLLFVEDQATALAAIRDLSRAHLHQPLHAPGAWVWLEGRLTRRLIVGDDSVIKGLHDTVVRHKRRVAAARPAFGPVPRPDGDELLAKLRLLDRKITILDGAAGTGKSTVVAEVTERLEDEGWAVAVTTMDGTHRSTSTSRQLGEAADLRESPAVLLSGVSGGAPALLVVEQLDAVSVYGGRMTDNFEAVSELLDEASRSTNVRILLVVRTVDLMGDPRLTSLLTDDVGRHTIGQLNRDRVRTHLVEHGIDVPDDQTLDLLRTPLHLSVYARLSSPARSRQLSSLQDLYGQYTDEVRRSIEVQLGSLDWAGIVTPLVESMSEHERLVAPVATVDHADRGQLGALQSASVLIRDGSDFRFFHESYMDFLFAHAFVASGRDTHDYLANSGQYLFRRAQTRQLLEYLAAIGPDRFRSTVVQLLASERIRAHLKDVVVSVLRGHHASEADWIALEEVAWAGTRTGAKVLKLLSHPQWFDAADAAGRWESWLADDGKVDEAFSQLIFAGRNRGRRVSELVRPYVGSSDDWCRRLHSLISWSITGELVDLAVDLVDRGLLDDARGPIAVNSDFWSIIHQLHEEKPVGAARLTGAYLRRGLARARADEANNPFESGHLDRRSQSASVITKIAAAAPGAFLTEILPFVIDVATTDATQIEGRLPVGHWAYRAVGPAHGVDDLVLHGCLTALRRLPDRDPEHFVELLDSFRWIESEELRFLACLAHAAGVQAGCITVTDAVNWLLFDQRNLSVGWSDARYEASRKLISVCSDHATDEELQRIEQAILHYETQSPWRPHEARQPFTLMWPTWRYGQFCLLSAVDEELLSSNALRRLGELRRRFGMDHPPRPQTVEARFVDSPVPSRAAQYMSDANWLDALQAHDGDETDWTHDPPVGGARELASVLGQQAKEDPTRFAALAMRFDEDVPAAAIASVLYAVGGHVSPETLSDLCLHAYATHGSDVAQAICWAVQKGGEASPSIAELLVEISLDPDPTQELAHTPADGSDGDPYYGGDLDMAGLNCTRGLAAIAAGALLQASDDHIDALTPVVEQLARDHILAVRVSAASAVAALTRHDPDLSLDIAAALFETDDNVLNADRTEVLLRWCLVRDAERFASVVHRALTGPGPMAKRGGRMWAVADYHGILLDPLPGNLSDLTPSARVGAAEVYAANAHSSVEQLTELFSDLDPEVRSQAAGVWWNLDGSSSEILDQLTKAFISSPALEDDDLDGLVRVYARLPGVLPTTTFEVCERVISTGGTELGDIRTARSAASGDLISLVLRMYRQSDDDGRNRCLDLIDELVELNAYDVDRALENER